MAIKPLQSNSPSVPKTEKPSSSSSRGESVSNSRKREESDAVRVSLKSDRPEQAPPPPPPPTYSRPSRENNFKDIDSDGSGDLSKDELTSAQERRQAEGKRTPFIDRALESFDKQTEDSDEGITFEQFYKGDKSAPPPRPPQSNENAIKNS